MRRPLKIHVAAPELWTSQCNEDWGYAYHLERWFRKLVLEHAPGLVAESAEDADFVYVAHCAMNVYLSWKQARFEQLRQRQLEGAAAVHDGRGPAQHGQGDVLHQRVLRELDASYLAGGVARAAQASAAARSCVARSPRCRLLFVNMAFGRDELPRFDAVAGREAVFVTTAGAEPRIPPASTEAVAPPRFQGRASVACSCRLHCKRRPSLGPLDVVVPFASAHNSTSGRTGHRGRRDLLALFIGSNTSCSRRELFERWANKAALLRHRLLVSAVPLDGRAFDQAVRRTAFCLVPDGHWPATQRLAVVVARGCVPVVISNRVELPFSDLIDWGQVALRLHEGQIRVLPEVLRAVTAHRLQAMQGHLRHLAEALDYHHPRFHSLLLASLAARRGPAPGAGA